MIINAKVALHKSVWNVYKDIFYLMGSASVAHLQIQILNVMIALRNWIAGNIFIFVKLLIYNLKFKRNFEISPIVKCHNLLLTDSHL